MGILCKVYLLKIGIFVNIWSLFLFNIFVIKLILVSKININIFKLLNIKLK